MKFSDFMDILFVSYLPIIIFVISGVISIRKSMKEKKKKDMDKYESKNRDFNKKYINNKNKDAFGRTNSNYRNFSRKIDRLIEEDKEKNLNNKKVDSAKNISENNNKSQNINNEKSKNRNKLSLNQTPLSEIPFIGDESSYDYFDDDFYDFDTEKVAEIYIYKEIFDKPLSLR